MPTINENASHWDVSYDWHDYGDEWSHAWGGPEAQWFSTIFPRIHAFIPTETILEIAPGCGRWTQFLKNNCRHLIAVDLSERCIEICKKRFSADSHIDYYVNDGKSLDFIPEKSIDFIFSFDSLVHADADVMEAYIRQLATKLRSNGVGFIHHSNVGSYLDPLTNELPPDFADYRNHWRGGNMSAKLFEEYSEAVNLQCLSQETINWAGSRLVDALSLFARKESVWSRPNRVLENPEFMTEASYISRLAPLYSFRVSPPPVV